MNREDRLLDFVLFVLSDFEELLNYVNWFFYQKEEGDPLSKNYKPIVVDYLEYVNKYIDPLPDSLLNEKKAFNDDFQEFDEFLKNSERILLLKYLNNYRHGYPDGSEDGLATGGNYQMNINEQDLSIYFDRYLKFKNVNNRVYLSFFVQLFYGIEEVSRRNLKTEIEKLDRDKLEINKLEPRLAEEFKKLTLNRYKKKLYKSILKNKIQVAGFFQDFKKNKVFISFEETLINQLSLLPKDFDDYNLDFKLDSSISHLSLKYLNYSYFAITPEISEENKMEREARQLELDEIKKKKSSLISFLNEKGLTDGDINILFNLLNGNKFSILSIPHIELTTQVMQFHILYAFYVFDFYKDNLESINDFSVLISKLTLFDKKSAEQFRKYYRSYEHGENPNKNNPFARIDKTFDKIQKSLNIDREKLKELPRQNLYGSNVLI